MKYYDFTGTEKKVSQLVKGSDYFTTDTIDRVSEMLDAFFEMGGTTIDTAHNYRGGESEKAIGLWMERRNNREKVVILTKGCYNIWPSTTPRVNPEAIDHDLMTSLERLKTDYIDLYALHRDDEAHEVGPLLETLNKHLEAGRIRKIGASNWTIKRLEEAAEYAEKHGLVGFSFSSPNLSLAKANESWWQANISVSLEDLDWYEKAQMPIISWSSQARGFFTGRYSPDKRDFERKEDQDLVRVFFSDGNWERYRRAEQLGKEKGVSTIQIALAYVLNQPFPACAIIGAQSRAELASCNDATQIKLTTDELKWLDLRK